MKRRFLISVMAVMFSFCLAFGSVMTVSADTTDKSVEGDVSKIIQWAQTSEWTDEGLAVYAGQWAGGGLRMFFDVSNGKEFNIKFKVPVYEEDSENYIVENGNMYSKYIVDVFVQSFNNSGMTVLRLWGDSGKQVGVTNLSSRITVGDLHDKTAASNPNEVAEGVWVKGALRASKEFDISFNTTDFFKSYWGDWDTTGSLLTMSGSVANGEAVKNSLNAAFNPEGNPCETVQVFFRLSAQCPTAGNNCTPETCPEHAANAMSKVIITEINGQSLANNAGNVVDTVAPYLAPVKVKDGAEFYKDAEYAIEVKGSPRESATKTLYCDYESDVLCYERLSHKVTVTAPSGAISTFDGLSGIKFTETGKNKISVTATDLAGNSYTTPETEIDVIRGFVLTVEGVPTTGTVGQPITLPAGVATDAHDNACPVSIKVEDPYTKAVEVTDLTFTPDKAGVYIVTYSASSEDGQSDKQSFRVTVTAPVDSGNGGEGSLKSCNSSLTGGSLVTLALMGVAIIVSKKFRKE